jgi:hypothetical protein
MYVATTAGGQLTKLAGKGTSAVCAAVIAAVPAAPARMPRASARRVLSDGFDARLLSPSGGDARSPVGATAWWPVQSGAMAGGHG